MSSNNDKSMEEENEQITAQLLLKEIKDFRAQQKTLHLASINKGGRDALASYAPFVEIEDKLFLLLSDLAEHSANLKSHAVYQSQISVMLIEDEHQSRNIFARKRLSYQCTVEICSREHERWQEIINHFKQHFGKTIDVLSGLSDFNLYCLKPQKGNYVRGFGQAYELRDAKEPILSN